METIDALEKILKYDSQVHIYGIPLTEEQKTECEEIVDILSESCDIDILLAIGLCLETMADSSEIEIPGTNKFLARC